MSLANAALRAALWSQFGAAISFLEETMRACPDDLWTAQLWRTPDAPHAFSEFWYVGYHTLFWLDCYLTGSEEGFLPPEPFLLIEQYVWGPMPERVYTSDELDAYLHLCRQRCRATIDGLTEVRAQQVCSFGWGSCSFFELLLYNMRHVQGHASQMNMLLGRTVGPQLSWIGQVQDRSLPTE